MGALCLSIVSAAISLVESLGAVFSFFSTSSTLVTLEITKSIFTGSIFCPGLALALYEEAVL